jgi:hypothetical protein
MLQVQTYQRAGPFYVVYFYLFAPMNFHCPSSSNPRKVKFQFHRAYNLRYDCDPPSRYALAC